jgi:ABC-type multidrug transport system ATPase subunit
VDNNNNHQRVNSNNPFPFMTALHVDSVRKAFGDRTILNDVFLSCKEGEIVGILGRNGSGKSTLLKIIFGSIIADNKFVSVDSRKTKGLFGIPHLIHYLPQHNFLPAHIKIKRLIICFCAKARAEALMQNDFIIPFLSKKTRELSGGERRIIEILILLHGTAKVVLLDEPFHNIAPLQIEQIKAVIKAHAANKAVIITDHSYQNVIDISSRIILMEDGNTRQIKEFEELFKYEYLPESLRPNPLDEVI